MEIAMIGLGRMGKNMALQLNRKGHDVVCWNRSEGPRVEVERAGCRTVAEIEEIPRHLRSERKIVWLMLPAGEVTDSVVEKMVALLEPGDILINGANNHWTRTLYHYARVSAKGIAFLDAGVSGGTLATRLGGYCVMVGGDREAFEHAEQIFCDLCVPQGYGYFGRAGAGHYVKMVHNGIEYAHMEAIGEGFEILKGGSFAGELDLHKIADVWDHGSILAGTLMWATRLALEEDAELTHIAPFIEDSGEGKWTLEEAIAHNIPFSTGAFALFSRWQSREKECYAWKLVAAQRNAFGGHAMKKE